MKKCPFLTNITYTEQWNQEPHSDGNIAEKGKTVYIKQECHTKCLEHECGAYYDGRCHYSEHI